MRLPQPLKLSLMLRLARRKRHLERFESRHELAHELATARRLAQRLKTALVQLALRLSYLEAHARGLLVGHHGRLTRARFRLHRRVQLSTERADDCVIPSGGSCLVARGGGGHGSGGHGGGGRLGRVRLLRHGHRRQLMRQLLRLRLRAR